MAHGRIALALDSVDAQVQVRFEGIPQGPVAEFGHLILTVGGSPAVDGYVLPVLAFRRAAVDFAQLMRVHQLDDSAFDAPTRLLLLSQLQDIRARRAAERGISPWSPDKVREAVTRTGRFHRALTERQVRDLGRLLTLQHSANFSVPGAGKTTSLLAIYESLRAQGDVDRLLVIAPKNAFLSWEQEIQFCFRLESRPLTTRLTGGAEGVIRILAHDPEVALITYQLLPNVLEVVKRWAGNHRTLVTLDESHRIKAGYAGILATSTLQLAEVGQRRVILTGTPVPHSPEDLRPQLEFLWPGQRIMPDFRIGAESSQSALDDVRARIGSLYTRTTKRELGLPPLEGPKPLTVRMGPIQRELYDLLRGEANRTTSIMTMRDRQFFRAIGRHVLRLLQAATNPMLLTHGELVDRPEARASPTGVKAWELLRDYARYERPSKVAAVVGRANELIQGGRKVLIWSSFVGNLMALERLLVEHRPVVLYGQVPTGETEDDDTREGRIRRFHEDDSCRVMIANPAACGEGISLHRACHHAIYLDRTFNAAHFLQSIDRIHRLGLESDVVTYVDVIEASNSIDQTVTRRLAKKIESMATILNDPGLRELAYDPEDVIEEFPAGVEPEDIEEVVDHLSGNSQE